MSKLLAIIHVEGYWWVVKDLTAYGPFDTQQEAAEFAAQLSLEAA
jgi:hypothetical protein